MSRAEGPTPSEASGLTAAGGGANSRSSGSLSLATGCRSNGCAISPGRADGAVASLERSCESKAVKTDQPALQSDEGGQPANRTRLPTDSPEAHELVREEVVRYWKDLDRQASRAHSGAYWYKVLNAVVSWGTIGLAGLAAVGAGVGDFVPLTVASAAGAAIAAAIQKTVDPAVKARVVRDESIEWERLATRFRHLALFELPELSAADARHELEELLDARTQLDKTYIGTRPERGELKLSTDAGKRRGAASTTAER
jgi:hypothetical protein